MEPNLKKLKDVRNYIRTIPKENIQTNRFATKWVDDLSQSIFCPLGWICHHPFLRGNLYLEVTFNSKGDIKHAEAKSFLGEDHDFETIGRDFGLDEYDTDYLFGAMKEDYDVSDKKDFLFRLDAIIERIKYSREYARQE